MTTAQETGLPVLSAVDQTALLEAARGALRAHFEGSPRPTERVGSAILEEPFATFVTLRQASTGELRGCRGEIRARQPLIDSVREMAVASAVGDPRFEPLRRSEIDDLTIDISVLSPMWPIRPEDVEVGRHGLMIVRGHRSGLLLPSVPAAFGWGRERFLEGLCSKAGLVAAAWRDEDVELLAFETATWGETD